MKWILPFLLAGMVACSNPLVTGLHDLGSGLVAKNDYSGIEEGAPSEETQLVKFLSDWGMVSFQGKYQLIEQAEARLCKLRFDKAMNAGTLEAMGQYQRTGCVFLDLTRIFQMEEKAKAMRREQARPALKAKTFQSSDWRDYWAIYEPDLETYDQAHPALAPKAKPVLWRGTLVKEISGGLLFKGEAPGGWFVISPPQLVYVEVRVDEEYLVFGGYAANFTLSGPLGEMLVPGLGQSVLFPDDIGFPNNKIGN